MSESILQEVRRRIRQEDIDISDAASAIGIGVSALKRHLSGEYVRSDSLAKYRLWLSGDKKEGPIVPSEEEPASRESTEDNSDFSKTLLMESQSPKPWNVVDLFCGCGGLSLGFERFNDGANFNIAMGLDIELPMVKVFNDNHPSPSEEIALARQADISDFMNESEILAYYLDHLARSSLDEKLQSELQLIGYGGVPALRKRIHEIDELFLEKLAKIRTNSNYISAIKGIGSGVLGQTSIAGFHSATKLPATGLSSPKVTTLIWHMDGPTGDTTPSLELAIDQKSKSACRARARKLWHTEQEKLRSRSQGSGRGQLASSAKRILKFLAFLESPEMLQIKKLWIDWRSEREATRNAFFSAPKIQKGLRKIYRDGRQVSVLLGGPPCQGFSRIGRGKIRSLHEQRVHVHHDENSVDSRNQLMHQYVLFVSALAPDIFLFENVRHFQATVKSDGIAFDAADILAEAIESISEQGLGYSVSKNIVTASRHSIPQGRERFVMAGVRRDADQYLSTSKAAQWCLALPNQRPVPLKTALEGLPEPQFDPQNKDPVIRSTDPTPLSKSQNLCADDIFRQWVLRGRRIDAHIARKPREDDAAFFALIGPGKRWMDYRCDDTPTLNRIQSVFKKLQRALSSLPELSDTTGINSEEISELTHLIDGSLSLRLLLEGIEAQPGELQHHLLTNNYLSKREGAHGDWLARMDPVQPSKTIVSHMAKDTYAYIHPFLPRTLSVREAARIQSFPDDYKFSAVGLVDGFKVIGNAVPPLLSFQFAERVSAILSTIDHAKAERKPKIKKRKKREAVRTTQ